MLLDHTIFLVSHTAINETAPRRTDQYSPVPALEEPIRLEGGPPPVFNGEKSPHVIPLTVPGAEYGGLEEIIS